METTLNQLLEQFEDEMYYQFTALQEHLESLSDRTKEQDNELIRTNEVVKLFQTATYFNTTHDEDKQAADPKSLSVYHLLERLKHNQPTDPSGLNISERIREAIANHKVQKYIETEPIDDITPYATFYLMFNNDEAFNAALSQMEKNFFIPKKGFIDTENRIIKNGFVMEHKADFFADENTTGYVILTKPSDDKNGEDRAEIAIQTKRFYCNVGFTHQTPDCESDVIELLSELSEDILACSPYSLNDDLDELLDGVINSELGLYIELESGSISTSLF